MIRDMSDLQIPSACSVALKEWATVLTAMARGEQLILVRKGGLIEPGRGFELVSPTFVFYPTFEHQAVNYVRDPYPSFFDSAVRARAPEGQVRIELGGAAVSCVQSRDPSLIERLAPFHIYHPSFVSQRLKWQPDQPVVIVAVRAFRLLTPQLLSLSPRYAGCKSWVELEAPLALGDVRPVLDDATFRQRLRELTALLSPSISLREI